MINCSNMYILYICRHICTDRLFGRRNHSFVFTADTVWGVNDIFSKQVVVKTAAVRTKTSV